MKKSILFIFLTFVFLTYGEKLPAEKARGFFVSIGVGPRLPVGSFSNQSDLGYGFNLEFSYTDNEYLPIFIFAKSGFEQYPGSAEFYQTSEYNNLSTTSFPVVFGLRYYFAPITENVVLFMPIAEVSAVYNFFSRVHQFKPTSGRNNFTEEVSKVGFNAGVGISMFLVEIMLNYNYFQSLQFIGVDLKVRLPLYISF
jgi:hypothetical protein